MCQNMFLTFTPLPVYLHQNLQKERKKKVVGLEIYLHGELCTCSYRQSSTYISPPESSRDI